MKKVLFISLCFLQFELFANDFLEIPYHPRISGLNSAFSSIKGGIESQNINPAGLSFMKGLQFSSSYSNWLADTNNYYVGIGLPTKIGNFGVSYFEMSSNEMDYLSGWNLKGIFKPKYSYLSAGYGINIKNIFSIGANFKQLKETLTGTNFKNSTLNLYDTGILFTFGKLNLSYTVNNIGLEKTSNHIGASFNFHSTLHSADFSFILEKYNKDLIFFFFFLGMNTIYLRAGYILKSEENYLDELSKLSLSVGVKIKSLLFEYAYLPKGNLGTINQFSLSYKFGSKKIKIPDLKINISANPFIISPNNDGKMDGMEIDVLTEGKDIDKEISSWTLNIYNSTGIPVKVFSSKKEEIISLPEKVFWQGEDENNDILPDGEYSAIMDVNLKGYDIPVKSNEERLLIDNTPPAIMIKGEKSFSPDGDGKADTATFSLFASDNYNVKKWLLKVIWKNKLIKKFEGTGQPPEKIIWDGKDDVYEEIVKPGKYKYKLIAWDSAENINKTKEQEIEVKIKPKIKIVYKEIKIKKDERGLKVNLKSSLLFKRGKAKLSSASFKSLDEVVQLIKSYPENLVSVEGHTDSVGSAAYNKKLSLKRAKAVRDYLVKKGINSKRLKVVGWGEEKPIASNRTRAGRMANRRVEVIILKEKVKDKKD